MTLNRILLHLAKLFTYFSWIKFKHDLGSFQTTQINLLNEILDKFSTTSYGIDCHINSSDTYDSFTKKVPLVSYSDIEKQINDQARYDRNQLCPGPVKCFESTSGSSGMKKLIPYNNEILNSFTFLFKVWVYDLLKNGPKLKSGKIWYSVSPQFGEQKLTESGVKKGLSDDKDYINGISSLLLGRFSVVPESIRKISDPDEYFLVLACLLICAEDLEIISIWNPVFLIKLLEFIEDNKVKIGHLLVDGSIEINQEIFIFNASKRVLHKLKSYRNPSELWSDLKIISCWDNANAGMSADKLRSWFPNTFIQGKGLLSTEAPITIPLILANGAIPFVSEVFFEFISDQDDVFLLEGLKLHLDYEVLITQKSGLIRYRTGDRVKVNGFYQGVPLLEFQSRTGEIADICGEKLHGDRIRDAIKNLNFEGKVLTLPIQKENSSYYLFLCDRHLDKEMMEFELCKNYHYQLARNLKQLEPCEIYELENIDQVYQEFCMVHKEMKLGDIKSTLLIKSLKEASDFLKFLEFNTIKKDF